MTTNRREFVGLMASSVAGMAIGPAAISWAAPVRVQAVAFDAFAILDPRPVFTLAEELFPGKGLELSAAWRTRQFEYAWLRSLGGRYADFWQVTEDALSAACRSINLDLNQQTRAQLMQAYLKLKGWPEVPQALEALRAAGVRLALLSNFAQHMLEAGIANAGLKGVFEHLLSTDRVKEFKPAPRAYQMAVNAFGLKPEAIVFAAFAGWDASGAKWFGFPTVWVNRLNSTAEELSKAPDLTCNDLSGLVAFTTAHR
jgi:2-haloacid dehalogenase